MKRLLVLPLMLLAMNANAGDVLPNLRVPNAGGTMMELREVRVMRVEPDGLRVMHSMGMAKVPYEALPEDLRLKYGINSSDAQKHREEAQAPVATTTPAKPKTPATGRAAAPVATANKSTAPLVTKEHVKAKWLAQYDPNTVCPQSPGGAAKREALTKQCEMIRAGAWDTKAEEYAKQANARAGVTVSN